MVTSFVIAMMYTYTVLVLITGLELFCKNINMYYIQFLQNYIALRNRDK